MTNSLAEKAKLLSIELSTEQVEAFETYLQELASFNEHTNLVSRSDAEIVIDNHILDSLTLVPILKEIYSAESGSELNSVLMSLIDIGSGAGFPGLMLAIACPFLEVTLVESTGKKCAFLSTCVESLELGSRVSVLNERAEDLAHVPRMRERFDLATARAVGSVEMITEFCLPFLRVGGYLLSQKSSGQLDSELKAAEPAIQVLGGKVEDVLDVENDATGKDFAVVVIEKVSKTPGKYPRAFGQIKKGGIKS